VRLAVLLKSYTKETQTLMVRPRCLNFSLKQQHYVETSRSTILEIVNKGKLAPQLVIGNVKGNITVAGTNS